MARSLAEIKLADHWTPAQAAACTGMYTADEWNRIARIEKAVRTVPSGPKRTQIKLNAQDCRDYVAARYIEPTPADEVEAAMDEWRENVRAIAGNIRVAHTDKVAH